MREAPRLIIRSWEQIKEVCELIDHRIVIARIITGNTEKLIGGE